MPHVKKSPRLLAADWSGAIAPLFGLMIMISLFVVAFCMDMVRAYNVRTQLQAALDAAALTGAKMLQEDNATDAAVQAAAEAIFKTYLTNIKVSGIATSGF